MVTPSTRAATKRKATTENASSPHPATPSKHARKTSHHSRHEPYMKHNSCGPCRAKKIRCEMTGLPGLNVCAKCVEKNIADQCEGSRLRIDLHVDPDWLRSQGTAEPVGANSALDFARQTPKECRAASHSISSVCQTYDLPQDDQFPAQPGLGTNNAFQNGFMTNITSYAPGLLSNGINHASEEALLVDNKNYDRQRGMLYQDPASQDQAFLGQQDDTTSFNQLNVMPTFDQDNAVPVLGQYDMMHPFQSSNTMPTFDHYNATSSLDQANMETPFQPSNIIPTLIQPTTMPMTTNSLPNLWPPFSLYQSFNPPTQLHQDPLTGGYLRSPSPPPSPPRT